MSGLWTSKQIEEFQKNQKRTNGDATPKDMAVVHSIIENPNTEVVSLEEYALDAIRRGFYVFPCNPGGKEPAGEVVPNGVLDASNNPDVVRAWWKKNPNYNPAIALGPSNLVCYDYDTIDTLADAPPTLRIRSGRIIKEGEFGGIHDYYRGSCQTHSIFVEPVEPIREEVSEYKGKKIVKKFDALNRLVGKRGVEGGEVRSRGAYVVWAGAIHKSGRRYEIVNDIPLADSPEQNEETRVASEPTIGNDKQNEIAGFVESAFDESGINYRKRTSYKEGFMWLIDCPWEYEHTSGRDLEHGGSASAVFMAASGALGYKCKHAHCDGVREWKELRGWMEETAGHRLVFGVVDAKAQAADAVETIDAWLDGKKELKEHEVFENIARLTETVYEHRRKKITKKLEWSRPSVLDDERKARQPKKAAVELQGDEAKIVEIEPWNEPVKLHVVLAEVESIFRKYIGSAPIPVEK